VNAARQYENYYEYDPAGNRTLLRHGETGGESRTFVHGGTPIPGIGNMVDYSEDDATQTFHYDHRGTVYGITDGSQDVSQTYEHDAWGVRLSSAGSLENPIQYQGCAWLCSVDIADFSHSATRQYAPSQGRFSQTDPASDKEWGLLRAPSVTSTLTDLGTYAKALSHVHPTAALWPALKGVFARISGRSRRQTAATAAVVGDMPDARASNPYSYAHGNPVLFADASGGAVGCAVIAAIVAVLGLAALVGPAVWRYVRHLLHISGSREMEPEEIDKAITAYRQYAEPLINHDWDTLLEDTERVHWLVSDKADIDDLLGATVKKSLSIVTIILNKRILEAESENDRITLAAVVAHEVYHAQEGEQEPPAYLLHNEVIRFWDLVNGTTEDEGYEKWLGKRTGPPDNWRQPCIYGRRPKGAEKRDFPPQRDRVYTAEEDADYALVDPGTTPP